MRCTELIPVAAIVVAAGLLLACKKKTPSSTRVDNRLSVRLKARPDLRVYVGVPIEKPDRWQRATQYTSDEVMLGNEAVSVEKVMAFVVAYPNGQMLDAEMHGLGLPEGLTGLSPGKPASEHITLDPRDAARGLELIDVQYSPSPANPDSVSHYSTAVTNRAGEPIRITRFGAFVKLDGEYRLSTVTGSYFSAEEFIQWYQAPADGWLPDGFTATDPDNYGSPEVIWAYFAETKSGKKLVTGRLLPSDWRQSR